jgi:hypothetical protein
VTSSDTFLQALTTIAQQNQRFSRNAAKSARQKRDMMQRQLSDADNVRSMLANMLSDSPFPAF